MRLRYYLTNCAYTTTCRYAQNFVLIREARHKPSLRRILHINTLNRETERVSQREAHCYASARLRSDLRPLLLILPLAV